jgi:hypothetical protein
MLGPVLLALAGFALAFGILTGRSRRWPAAIPPVTRPPAAVVLAPLAGSVPHLQAFLAALHDQDYPQLRIILIIEEARETAGDPQEAARRIADLERAGLPPGTAVVRVPPATSSSQKAANLLAGLAAAGEAEVVAMVDADAMPHRSWLRDLVAPLRGGEGESGRLGGGPVVATGFRWYVPGPGLAALVRSAYSAAAMSLITDSKRAFAWGGSLAFRSCDLERLGIARAWRTALSDDMAVTRAVRGARGQVRFVPDCVVPSFGPIRWRALSEFAVRQLVMLRWGDRRLWGILVAVHALLAATQVGAVAAACGAGSLPWGMAGRAALVGLLAAPTVLGIVRARGRFAELAGRPLAHIPGWDDRRHAHIALAAIMPWLMLASLIAAAFQREVEWCGIRYRLSRQGAVEVMSGPGVTSP